MPAELMLVNPRKRRRKTARKMTAKQAKYFGPRRKRKSPVRRRRAAATTAAPKRRRRRTSVRRAHAAPVRRRRRAGSRRGIGSLLRSKSGGVSLSPSRVLKGEIVPALIGALGAVAADVVWASIPSQIIPANLKSGPLSPLVKSAVVIGAAFAVGKFANRRVGEAIAAGGLLVIGYDVVKGLMRSALPGLPLAEYISGEVGYISPAQFLPAPDIPQHLGEYISGAPSPSVGWSHHDGDVMDHVS